MMDHVWNSLKQWEYTWIEHLEYEKEGPDHEYKESNIELLTEQLEAIRKAMEIVGKWN